MGTVIGIVPARSVLTAAEVGGTEHLGALSASHGLLPRVPPARMLPSSHRAWDEAAEQLPALWRDTAARRVLAGLPLLDASSAALSPEHLWRASVVMACIAFSYVRCDLEDLHLPAPVALPEAIERPWRQLATRMGRSAPHVAHDDLVTHNWRLLDAHLADPMRLENLALSVPITGNDTERASLAAQIEVLAQLAPTVEAMVRAQEAVVADDRDALMPELLLILERLRHVTDVSLPKVSPNRHAAILCDPVLWAKLVAPTGIAITADAPGFGGTQSSPVQLLDAFVMRNRFESHVGAETRRLRRWQAPNLRRFLEALEEVSVSDYVARRGDRELAGVWQTLVAAFAGDRGYLGAHARKAYGYIQVAFKVGRPSTSGGITGTSIERTWRQTFAHLERAREERFRGGPVQPHVARLARRRPASSRRGAAQLVTLDIAGTGLLFRPGDCCAVYPEHSAALVARTLSALCAVGNEPIPLTAAWQEAVEARTGTRPQEMQIAEVLRWARLRPLTRRAAEALQIFSGSSELLRIAETGEEDRRELWDALEFAAAAGYDTRRLWRARIWQDECLTRIVEPEQPRIYSVSGRPDDATIARELDLTVGALRFGSRASPGQTTRQGACSTYLGAGAPIGSRVVIDAAPARRFALPDDPAQPIVMFAGGTGISPFRAFVQQRAAQPRSGRTWLFAAARSASELPHHAELQALARDGLLELRTAFSRESTDGRPPQRIDQAMLEPASAAALAELIRPHEQDGDGARVYVCGRAAFAASVLDALGAVVGGGEAEDRRRAIHRLVGEGRLMTDVFTSAATAPEHGESRVLNASELVLHNDAHHGWWTAIQDVVYDLTEFRELHPGGFRILDDNAGLDATEEYRAIRHHEDPEIEAMLAMYRIGRLRRLNLGRGWGVALVDGALRYVSLQDALRKWLRQLYLVVELENALRNDFGFLDRALTASEHPADMTALKVALVAEAQGRFLAVHIPSAFGAPLTELWAVAAGLFDPDADPTLLTRRLEAVANGENARRSNAAVDQLRRLARAAEVPASNARCLAAELQACNAAILSTVKHQLRQGLTEFERHERHLLARGAAVLASLAPIPETLCAFHERLATTIERNLGSEPGAQSRDLRQTV